MLLKGLFLINGKKGVVLRSWRLESDNSSCYCVDGDDDIIEGNGGDEEVDVAKWIA